MNSRHASKFMLLLILVVAAIHGCGKSESEMDDLLEEAYYEGYWDALDCVKRKGGSARSAVYSCD